MALNCKSGTLFVFLHIAVFVFLLTVDINEASGRLDKKKQSSLIDKTKTRKLLDKRRTFVVGADPYYYYLNGLYNNQRQLGKSKRLKRSVSRHPSQYYYQSDDSGTNNAASLSKAAEELNTLLLLLDGYAATVNNNNNGRVNHFEAAEEDDEGLIKRMRNTNTRFGHQTKGDRRKHPLPAQAQAQFDRGQTEVGPVETSTEKLEFLNNDPSKANPLVMRKRGKRIDTKPKQMNERTDSTELETTVFKERTGARTKKDIDWSNYFGIDKKSPKTEQIDHTVPSDTTTQESHHDGHDHQHNHEGVSKPSHDNAEDTEEEHGHELPMKEHEEKSEKDDKPDRKWILNEFYKNLAMASSFKRKRSSNLHSMTHAEAQPGETNELLLSAGDDLIDSALKLSEPHGKNAPSKHNLKASIINKLANIKTYDIALTRRKSMN